MPILSANTLFKGVQQLLMVILAFATLASVNLASASHCEISACPKGYTFNAKRGSCTSGTPPGYVSHQRLRCPTGYTMDRKRGICRRHNCVDCEKPACRRDETYGKGLCHSRSGFGGYKSHRIPNCGTGWRLITSRGVCRKNFCGVSIPAPRPIQPRPIDPRPAFRLKPDLVVLSTSAIQYGRFCQRGRPITVFRVVIKNNGLRTASGNSGQTKLRVYDRHYPNWSTSIATGDMRPGQTRTYHLSLPYLSLAPRHMTNTTPHPFVAVVDSTNKVDESNERNNSSRVRLLGAPAACLK